MSKPIIGIAGSMYVEEKPSFAGDYYDYNNNHYSQCIAKAGGIPIYLPVINHIDIIKEQLSLCDGLLFPGGADINPLIYNELPRPLLGRCNDLIDSYQINLAKLAFSTNYPCLGICRGMQLINIAAGGTLYQDISYATKTPLLHMQNGYLGDKCHPITINNDSLLNSMLGNKYLVNSGHHQCVNTVSSDFKITAKSPDGIIEAIENTSSSKLIFGVQWHPEMLSLNDDKMLNIFKVLIDNC